MKKIFLLFFMVNIFINNVFGLILSQRLIDDKKNPNAVEGVITMDRNFFDAMSALYPNSGVLNQGIVVELWSVVYRDQPLQTGRLQIVGVFLGDKQDIQITKSQRLEGNKSLVSYNISNIPEQGNYIVLFYFHKIPPNFTNTSISGFGDDGSNRNNVLYRSDAKILIGIDKTFSIYSIPKLNNRLPLRSNLDFIVQNLSGIQINGLAGRIGNFFGDLFDDLVEFVSDSGQKLVGFFADKLGQLIMKSIKGVRYLMDVRNKRERFSRTLTVNEYTWLNAKVFNGTLPERNRIIVTNFMYAKDLPITLPGCDYSTFYINMGSRYKTEYMFNSPYDNTLVHEMTHVWQIHHYRLWEFWVEGFINQVWDNICIPYVKDCSDSYFYNLGGSWNSYNFEQQAQMNEDFFNCTKYSPDDCAGVHDNELKDCTLQKNIVDNIRFGKLLNFEETYNTAQAAYPSTPLLKLQAGNYPTRSNLRLTQEATIKSCGGSVVIGKN